MTMPNSPRKSSATSHHSETVISSVMSARDIEKKLLDPASSARSPRTDSRSDSIVKSLREVFENPGLKESEASQHRKSSYAKPHRRVRKLSKSLDEVMAKFGIEDPADLSKSLDPSKSTRATRRQSFCVPTARTRSGSIQAAAAKFEPKRRSSVPSRSPMDHGLAKADRARGFSAARHQTLPPPITSNNRRKRSKSLSIPKATVRPSDRSNRKLSAPVFSQMNTPSLPETKMPKDDESAALVEQDTPQNDDPTCSAERKVLKDDNAEHATTTELKGRDLEPRASARRAVKTATRQFTAHDTFSRPRKSFSLESIAQAPSHADYASEPLRRIPEEHSEKVVSCQIPSTSKAVAGVNTSTRRKQSTVSDPVVRKVEAVPLHNGQINDNVKKSAQETVVGKKNEPKGISDNVSSTSTSVEAGVLLRPAVCRPKRRRSESLREPAPKVERNIGVLLRRKSVTKATHAVEAPSEKSSELLLSDRAMSDSQRSSTTETSLRTTSSSKPAHEKSKRWHSFTSWRKKSKPSSSNKSEGDSVETNQKSSKEDKLTIKTDGERSASSEKSILRKRHQESREATPTNIAKKDAPADMTALEFRTSSPALGRASSSDISQLTDSIDLTPKVHKDAGVVAEKLTFDQKTTAPKCASFPEPKADGLPSSLPESAANQQPLERVMLFRSPLAGTGVRYPVTAKCSSSTSVRSPSSEKRSQRSERSQLGDSQQRPCKSARTPPRKSLLSRSLRPRTTPTSERERKAELRPKSEPIKHKNAPGVSQQQSHDGIPTPTSSSLTDNNGGDDSVASSFANGPGSKAVKPRAPPSSPRSLWTPTTSQLLQSGAESCQSIGGRMKYPGERFELAVDAIKLNKHMQRELERTGSRLRLMSFGLYKSSDALPPPRESDEDKKQDESASSRRKRSRSRKESATPRLVKIREESVEQFYDIKDEIGKGKFGVVYRVCDRQTGQHYAAKFVNATRTEWRKMAEQEVRILSKLHHKKIVRLTCAFAVKGKRVLVTEMIEGGDLFDRVTKANFQLSEKVCIKFVRQICDALAYIHSQKVIHLDMKPENVMCISRESHRIKIIDFGLAQEVKDSDDLRTLCGTAEFAAPEVLCYDPIDYKTDIWSVGVIAYILLSGYSPFLGECEPETHSNVVHGEYDFDCPEFLDVSSLAKDFISHLLVKLQRNRISAIEALKHPWLQRPEVEKHNLKHKSRLRRYVIRRRWRKAYLAVVAIRRLRKRTAATPLAPRNVLEPSSLAPVDCD